VVRVAEITNPAHHRRGAEAVTRRPAGVVFNVQQPRQGAAISRPASAMGEEVVGLGGPRTTRRLREVVAAADQTNIGRSCVLGRELRVLVGCAFGCL